MCEQQHPRYAKPALELFGTFRELTRVGTDADGDMGILGVVDGCNLTPGAPGCEGRYS